jgi:hypothetical protein
MGSGCSARSETAQAYDFWTVLRNESIRQRLTQFCANLGRNLLPETVPRQVQTSYTTMESMVYMVSIRHKKVVSL